MTKVLFDNQCILSVWGNAVYAFQGRSVGGCISGTFVYASQIRMLWLVLSGIRVLCDESEEGTLQVPICAILLDAHDIVGRRVPVTFHY